MWRPGRGSVYLLLGFVPFLLLGALQEVFDFLLVPYDLLQRGSCLQELHSVMDLAPEEADTCPCHRDEAEEQVVADGAVLRCGGDEQPHCDPPDSEARDECQYEPYYQSSGNCLDPAFHLIPSFPSY